MIIALLLFIIVDKGHPQDVSWLSVTNQHEIKKIGDSIVRYAKRQFVFIEVKESPPHSDYFVAIYEPQNDSVTNVKLRVVCRKYLKGQNLDLEKPGEPEFRFDFAVGPFLDLFPFWKRFINPAAVLEDISIKRRDLIQIQLSDGKTVTFRFYKKDNVWYIALI